MGQPNQIILGANKDGTPTGEFFLKEVGHTGEGKRHLAIAVLLYNSKGEVLLQKRKHKVFDDIWDVTGATHPLHKQDGTNESFEEATFRCLMTEYGISKDQIKDLGNLGAFNYFAKYGGLCENEHCFQFVGKYEGEVLASEEVAYGYKWISKKEFLKDIEQNPNSYSPWAVTGIKLLKEKGFFN